MSLTPEQIPAPPAGAESHCAAPAAARTAGSDRGLDALVREHLPLIGSLVRDVTNRIPTHVNRDDLVSAGMLALVLAARSFDDSRGVPFGRFAALRIRGALTDELRSMDWATRSVRGKARQIRSVHDNLAAALGRIPTRLEIAAAMGVAVTDLDDIDADVHRATVVSLQAATADRVEDTLPTPAANPEELLIKREQIGYLHDAIAELPDRLRTVVHRSFFRQEKMADIAADLGVTESRVSQLRSEAIVMLRAALHAMDDDSTGDVSHRHGRLARQDSYARAVATRSTVAGRLDASSLLAEPRPLLAAAG